MSFRNSSGTSFQVLHSFRPKAAHLSLTLTLVLGVLVFVFIAVLTHVDC